MKDIQIYTERLAKGLVDKLFWINDVPENSCIFDFGCANGAVLKALSKIRPNFKLIGYDNSTEMFNLAKENCNGLDIEFYNTLESAFDAVRGVSQPKVLLLSSVLHELYSYDKLSDLSYMILGDTFDYCIVRDMFMSVNDYYRRAPYEDYIKILYNPKYFKQLMSFEEVKKESLSKKYGHFIEFLLKYIYIENWDKEVKEDYFPEFIPAFVDYIQSNTSLRLQKLERFYIPYLRNKIKEDFDIDLNTFTHAKMIFKKC